MITVAKEMDIHILSKACGGEAGKIAGENQNDQCLVFRLCGLRTKLMLSGDSILNRVLGTMSRGLIVNAELSEPERMKFL